MMDATKDLLEKAKSVPGSWGSYAAFGSFLLYLTGYLTLRFHLMAFGIFTDLAILDERYLFAGARFLVYFLGSFSILVMICLPFVPLVGWLRRREKLRSFRERLWAWWSLPNRLAFAGVVLSVVLIQGVMRQCLFFTNLLLRKNFPSRNGCILSCSIPPALASHSTLPGSLLALASSQQSGLWCGSTPHRPKRGRCF